MSTQASDAAAREQLEKVVEVLVTERCRTFEDCIAWARKRFQVCQSCLSCMHAMACNYMLHAVSTLVTSRT